MHLILAECFSTYHALEVCDRYTNTALTLPWFLFEGQAGDPVMDQKIKQDTAVKASARRNEYQCPGKWRDAKREVI